MSRTDTWMPLYIADYLADTRILQTLDHGAYLLLLMEYWRQGPLANDPAELCVIAGVDRKIFDRTVWPRISRFFTLHSDGLLHQKRIDEERARAVELSEKRRASALQRFNKGPNKTPPNGEHKTSNSSAFAEQKQTHARVAGPSQESSSLRSEAAGPPDEPPQGNPAADILPDPEPPSIGQRLFSEGLSALTRLTAGAKVQPRPLLAKWAKECRDDERLLGVILAAAEARPGDPISWIAARIKPQTALFAKPAHPCLNDPSEVWAPYADRMEVDSRDGLLHPVVADSFLDIVAGKVAAAAGIRADARVDWMPLVEWLREGLTYDQIVGGIGRIASRANYRPPASLRYFDNVVHDRMAA